MNRLVYKRYVPAFHSYRVCCLIFVRPAIAFLFLTALNVRVEAATNCDEMTYWQAFQDNGLLKLLDRASEDQDIFVELIKKNASADARHKVRIEMQGIGLDVLRLALARRVSLSEFIDAKCLEGEAADQIKQSTDSLVALAHSLAKDGH